ncbi:MAG: hypothetical protein ACK40G_13710 [Cytophagaceae bacterium]
MKKNIDKVCLWVLVLLFFAHCNKTENNSREVMLKRDLQRATSIIADKNQRQIQKLERQFKSDSLNAQLRKLYFDLKLIAEYKEEYKKQLASGEIASEDLTKEFLGRVYNVLPEVQNGQVKKIFRNSLIMEIEEEGDSGLLKLQLSLEAELMVQEIFKLQLREFGKKTPGFDWEIIWA